MRLHEINDPGLLTFRIECRGFHSGQSDCVLVASRDGIDVGEIEYAVYQGQPYVQMISVPEFRRQGIGAALVRRLQAEYPGVEINMGNTTEMGSKLIGSMPHTAHPNPEYDQLVARLEQLRAKEAAYQKMADAFYASPPAQAPGARPNEADRQKIYAIHDDWNAVNDEIGGIEDRLVNMQQSTRLFHESDDRLDFQAIPHDDGYIYHGTSRDRLYDIMSSGRLQTYRPWYGTEQSEWPDRSRDKRSYWGPSPGHVEPFIPDHPPAIVRARHDIVQARPERGTGDLYASKPVSARHLEYFDGMAWRPLGELAR